MAHPAALDVAPAIEALVDLGALPLPASGALNTDERDQVFTPGEWAAIVGPGIARQDAQVFMGGRSLPILAFLEQGVLVRVPRGLAPRERHRVEVQTPFGRASQPVRYASYVVVSDVSGNRLRFLRMSAEAERLFEEPQDVPLTRVRKHVFSTDGGLVYAVHAAGEGGRYALATVHLGAAEQPAPLGSLPLQLSGVPVDLVAAPARAQLWLLTQRELVVIDVRDALSPRELSRVALAPGTPWSLVAMAHDTRAVVLEREANALWYFDMTAATPSLVRAFALPPEGTPRASLALLADRSDPQQLWILQGRSLARLAQRAQGLMHSVRGSLARAKDVLGMGEPPPSETSAPSGDEQPAPPARVLGVTIGPDTLAVARELALPDAFVPLMLRTGVDGRLLVSGISSDATKLETVGQGREALSRITSWLAGSVQFGRVVAVDPTGARPTDTLAQGLAMFFDVDQLPDGQLVYSAMRLGVHMLPPGIGIDWRIEAPGVDAVGIRKLSWTFLLPPYVSPPVSVQ